MVEVLRLFLDPLFFNFEDRARDISHDLFDYRILFHFNVVIVEVKANSVALLLLPLLL